MFEKGKRERGKNQEDVIFNRMLLWLAGAVAVELLILLVRQVYVNMIFGGVVAYGLMVFFRVFVIAGAVLTVGAAVWTVLSARARKPVILPAALTAGLALLWVISALSYFMDDSGLKILVMLPAAGAVLILIFFLYQRPFFYNAVLTGGGMLAVWLYQQHYMKHPRLTLACFIGGWLALAGAAGLAFLVKKGDGMLGGLRVLPVESNYMMTWITCGITAAAMAAALILGVTMAHYLIFVLVGWLFAQAVFFTVKMM